MLALCFILIALWIDDDQLRYEHLTVWVEYIQNGLYDYEPLLLEIELDELLKGVENTGEWIKCDRGFKL